MKKFIKKHITLIVIFVFILLFILLAILSKDDSFKIESEEIKTWYEDTKKDEYVVSVLAQTTCSHCHNLKPIIEEVQNENGFKLHWIDIDTLSEIDRNAVTNIYKLENFEGTPHTFITKNGTLLKEKSGEMTKTKLISFLKAVGVIEN